MKYENLAQEIVEKVGGEANINSLTLYYTLTLQTKR